MTKQRPSTYAGTPDPISAARTKHAGPPMGIPPSRIGSAAPAQVHTARVICPSLATQGGLLRPTQEKANGTSDQQEAREESRQVRSAHGRQEGAGQGQEGPRPVSGVLAQFRETVGKHAAVSLMLAFAAGWIVSAVVR